MAQTPYTTANPSANLAEGLQRIVYGKSAAAWYAGEVGLGYLDDELRARVKVKSDELWASTICGSGISFDAFQIARRAAAADVVRAYNFVPDFLGATLEEYMRLREIGQCSAKQTTAASAGGSAVWWVLGGAAALLLGRAAWRAFR